jgi:hypothetical protein
MIYRQVHELAADGFPVAVICRCLGYHGRATTTGAAAGPQRATPLIGS